ncbi:endonuclease/exonuclease/phosphatase family protein [Nonomuraea wenchangensis]|uniref:endonuclease/exonuclease/phosphatase family protein n=1 Tax=Nonomuraea wenchangensis TaxID=568860 RepID=UPI00332E26ED
MIGHILIASLLSAPTTPAPTLHVMTWHVMTWNVCAGTNSACPLYRASTADLAWHVAVLATETDAIFLQEFCTGADADLERELEARTRRAWSVKSAPLTHPDGSPYQCHPDRTGTPRGTQSVTLAVARNDTRFEAHPLTSPPWGPRRYALCTAHRTFCTTHLSSGMRNDDRQKGAPYRHTQLRELLKLGADVVGGDLNLMPRAAAIAYKGRDECDPRNRWTYVTRKRKIDYLFAGDGRVRRCFLDYARSAWSDHVPLHAWISRR